MDPGSAAAAIQFTKQAVDETIWMVKDAIWVLRLRFGSEYVAIGFVLWFLFFLWILREVLRWYSPSRTIKRVAVERLRAATNKGVSQLIRLVEDPDGDDVEPEVGEYAEAPRLEGRALNWIVHAAKAKMRGRSNTAANRMLARTVVGELMMQKGMRKRHITQWRDLCAAAVLIPTAYEGVERFLASPVAVARFEAQSSGWYSPYSLHYWWDKFFGEPPAPPIDHQ